MAREKRPNELKYSRRLAASQSFTPREVEAMNQLLDAASRSKDMEIIMRHPMVHKLRTKFKNMQRRIDHLREERKRIDEDCA